MRVEPDKTLLYRESTNRMGNVPSQTFLCCRCKLGKSILGRRKVGMIGRRTLYACPACQEK